MYLVHCGNGRVGSALNRLLTRFECAGEENPEMTHPYVERFALLAALAAV
jgi:hypothetical protein